MQLQRSLPDIQRAGLGVVAVSYDSVDTLRAFADKHAVTFPMLSKVVVKGDDICPLYKHLTSEETNPKFAGEIKWNFTKFVVGRNGEIVARFEPSVVPDAPEVIKVIEEELKKK